MKKIIPDRALKRRTYWVEEIRKLSGNFGADTSRLEKELTEEISTGGVSALIDHLRLCGSIPESYYPSSSEEKLYSKYTDILLSLAYKAMGFKSLVLKERADAADVEVFAKGYSFVADAKAFRLSRTAKNAKDFKVSSMNSWKRGKPYAMVVCPIYQLHRKTGQIYEQATSHNVCVFTYSHLSLLLAFTELESKSKAAELLLKILKIIPALNPSKSAVDYWLTVNKTMLNFSKDIENLWDIEKQASAESIIIAKEEALTYLALEREKIMQLSHEEALEELIKVNKIESKIKIIKSISDNGLFAIK